MPEHSTERVPCSYAMPNGSAASQSLSDRDLTIGEDGRFEIVLSRERPDALGSASWLPLDESAHSVVVRQYFLDRSMDVPPAYDIEVVDRALTLRRLSEADVASLLQRVVRNCEFNSTIGVRFLTDLRDMPNEFVPTDTGRLMPFGPTPDNWYALAWYRLQHDEALVIEGDVPDAQCWGFHLHDRWMDTFDHPHRHTGINCREIPVEGGRFRVVIGPEPSDRAGWLDRGGRREGHLFFRAQRPERVSLPECRVVSATTI